MDKCIIMEKSYKAYNLHPEINKLENNNSEFKSIESDCAWLFPWKKSWEKKSKYIGKYR